MKNYLSIILTLLVSSSYALEAGSGFVESTSKVSVAATNIVLNSKKVVKYEFTVKNNSVFRLHSFDIGTVNGVEACLLDFASKPLFEQGAFFQSPNSWLGETFTNDFALNRTCLVWTLDDKADNAKAIAPGTSKSGFVFYSPRKIGGLIGTYVTLDSDYQTQKYQVTKVTKSDLIAPTGTVSPQVAKAPLKPNTPVSYTIKAAITAKDNIDPIPDIEFVSLSKATSTGNATTSPFGASEYTILGSNAAGKYADQFSIVAGATPVKYKLVYKIVDASDNAALISTDITIPQK